MFKNFNLKKISFALIIIMLSCFALGSTILIASGNLNFSFFSGITFGRYSTEIDEEIALDLTNITQLVVNTVSTDIHFIQSDETTPKIHYHGKYSSSRNNQIPKLSTSSTNTTYEIKIEYPKLSTGFTTNNLRLDIYLPKGFDENIKISTISGDAFINDYTIKDFDFKSVSGDLKAEDLIANKIHITTTSGKTKGSFICNDLYFKSISGSFNLSNITSGISEFHTTSGDITLMGNPGRLSFTSVSGDIQANLLLLKDSITVRTTSGDSRITLPVDSNFYLDFSTVSGKLSNKFPISYSVSKKTSHIGIVGEGDFDVIVKTVSGDLSILR